MKHIVADQAVVTADEYDREPTATELNAIEWETDVIRADVELLDAQITALDRVPNEVDTQRIRRARRRLLAARRDLENKVPVSVLPHAGDGSFLLEVAA
ncbi:DUF6284 family protein [Streptomyces sp. NPDC001270]|uniref:DUF6284 family protein n=1 Tax=Streptomyces sp. NPDC001270 TaxID=3364554 RepID=UPI003694B514